MKKTMSENKLICETFETLEPEFSLFGPTDTHRAGVLAAVGAYLGGKIIRGSKKTIRKRHRTQKRAITTDNQSAAARIEDGKVCAERPLTPNASRAMFLPHHASVPHRFLVFSTYVCISAFILTIYEHII